MTKQQRPQSVAAKCLFPTRSDGKPRMEQWAVVEFPRSRIEESMRFCLATKRDPRYFITLAWALVLWRFADTATVQIGMSEMSARGEGGLVRAGLKRRMKLLAASSMGVGAIDELLQEEAWTIQEALETHYADFNTGIVLYEGCPNRELDTATVLNQLCKTDDEVITRATKSH